ncbi:amidohydrolase [Tuberibacillus sp. Marseille-P3662]|uniref:amidohydrolase n=1 Tax=Tuberibacillus sp. Marseille-P3662 TaxID=1965358 RepID=UPI000A1CBAA6|nr:amidohydrolase [Tuberibacillus sp. Marseille-P3662]
MEADLIFQNGEVITVDDRFTVCEALAVGKNKILGHGRNGEMDTFRGPHTKIIDLKGRSLLPGFNDAHAHLELYGTNKLGVNCKDVNSIEEMVEKLKQVAEKTSEGKWIRGWGYNQNDLDEKRHPTRWDLDRVSTDHPIIIVRTCGHISTVNSKALDLAGIETETADPSGGKIVRENDTPNGVLLEAAHMNMFIQAQYPEQEIMEGLRLASEDFIKKGITSVTDAGGYNNDHFRYLIKAVQAGNIKTRVNTLIGSLRDSPTVLDRVLESGMLTGLGNETFRIGPAKVFIDGSSSGPTAKTREPYTSNPDDTGILYLSQEELNEILGKAHSMGWQLTAHAMGDKGVEMMINCIESALQQHSKEDHRHRIEHSGITPPDLINRKKDLNIVPVPNPAFIQEFGDGYLEDYGDRVNWMFPVRSFLDAGMTPAMGSDSPITTCDPLVGIQAAVTRLSKTGREIGTKQKISIHEAIRLYTINGAYASFEEKIKGSLEKGKAADLVVLDGPILDTSKDQIQDMAVDMTVINGEIVYQKELEVEK